MFTLFFLVWRCQSFFSSHSKSGDVIEPVLKPQWWVNCKPLAEEAIKVRHPSLCPRPFSLTLPFISAHARASWK